MATFAEVVSFLFYGESRWLDLIDLYNLNSALDQGKCEHRLAASYLEFFLQNPFDYSICIENAEDESFYFGKDSKFFMWMWYTGVKIDSIFFSNSMELNKCKYEGGTPRSLVMLAKLGSSLKQFMYTGGNMVLGGLMVVVEKHNCLVKIELHTKSCCDNIHIFTAIATNCFQLTHLDLANQSVWDVEFDGIEELLPLLSFLNLSNCRSLTTRCIFGIQRAAFHRTLEYLNLKTRREGMLFSSDKEQKGERFRSLLRRFKRLKMLEYTARLWFKKVEGHTQRCSCFDVLWNPCCADEFCDD